MNKSLGILCWLILPVLVLGAAAAFLLLKQNQPQAPVWNPVQAPPGPPWFKDVSAEIGLDFTHDPGPIDGNYFMPQIMGSGAALWDFNQDGAMSIFFRTAGRRGRKTVFTSNSREAASKT